MFRGITNIRERIKQRHTRALHLLKLYKELDNVAKRDFLLTNLKGFGFALPQDRTINQLQPGGLKLLIKVYLTICGNVPANRATFGINRFVLITLNKPYSLNAKSD